MPNINVKRGRLAAALRNLLETIRLASCAQVRIEFDAPWNSRARSGC